MHILGSTLGNSKSVVKWWNSEIEYVYKLPSDSAFQAFLGVTTLSNYYVSNQMPVLCFWMTWYS